MGVTAFAVMFYLGLSENPSFAVSFPSQKQKMRCLFTAACRNLGQLNFVLKHMGHLRLLKQHPVVSLWIGYSSLSGWRPWPVGSSTACRCLAAEIQQNGTVLRGKHRPLRWLLGICFSPSRNALSFVKNTVHLRLPKATPCSKNGSLKALKLNMWPGSGHRSATNKCQSIQHSTRYDVEI